MKKVLAVSFFLTLLLFFIVATSTTTFINAEDFVLSEADPASTTTGEDFNGFHGCVKDKAESIAICSCGATCVLKLTLSPAITFASKITTGATSFSVVLYEAGSLSRVFYNDNGVIKYTDSSTFSAGAVVDKTALSSSYTVVAKSHMTIDATNKIIYVSDHADVEGDSHVLKITNIDTTPIFVAGVISLPGCDDKKSADLIVANNDLYVALSLDPGRVARVATPSTATESTKTVIFTQANSEISYYRCLHHIGNFLYVVTYLRSHVVKLSIGSSDADFAEVSSSPSADGTATNQGNQEFLVTPDSAILIVLATASGKAFYFNVDTMTYRSTTTTGPLYVSGGVLTSKGKVVLTSSSDSVLHHYTFPVQSPSSGSSSLTSDQKMSIGIGVGVGVPFVALFILAVCCTCKAGAAAAAGDGDSDAEKEDDNNNNQKKTNAPDDDEDKEMDEHNQV